MPVFERSREYGLIQDCYSHSSPWPGVLTSHEAMLVLQQVILKAESWKPKVLIVSLLFNSYIP